MHEGIDDYHVARFSALHVPDHVHTGVRRPATRVPGENGGHLLRRLLGRFSPQVGGAACRASLSRQGGGSWTPNQSD